MQNKKLFIPYITSGYPTKKSFIQTLETISSLGVDFIEVGIPHSDPLADGPIIQHSSKIAIENGANLLWVINTLKSYKNSKKLSQLILFSYFNPIHEYGLEKLLKDLPKNLFHGLIIPDLPLEEAEKYLPLFKKHKLNLILLIAPTTQKNKIKKIVSMSTSFIYMVSVAGVTGKSGSSNNLKSQIKYIKSLSKKPVVVGFGISDSNDQKKMISIGADGVIVGSAIVKNMENPVGLNKKLTKFIEQFI